MIAAIVAAAENHVDVLSEESHAEARFELMELPVDHCLGHFSVAVGDGVAHELFERIHAARSGAPVHFEGKGLK